MYQIFEQLLKVKGVSTSDVAKATGIAKSVFSSWKNGTSAPKADKVFLVAQYFGVPMEIFFESDEEKVEAMLYEAMHKEYSIEHHETVRIPVYDTAAGQGRVNGTYTDEYKEEEDLNDNNEYVWCRVYGDSMYPILHDGDYIKVRLQTQTNPQDLTVVKINGDEATVKYVEIVENGVWLRAENKDVFQDRFFTVSEVMSLPVTIVGKVVMSQRNFT